MEGYRVENPFDLSKSFTCKIYTFQSLWMPINKIQLLQKKLALISTHNSTIIWQEFLQTALVLNNIPPFWTKNECLKWWIKWLKNEIKSATNSTLSSSVIILCLKDLEKGHRFVDDLFTYISVYCLDWFVPSNPFLSINMKFTVCIELDHEEC